MSFSQEHVETWLKGIRLQNSLDPFQRIIFQWFTCMKHEKRKENIEKKSEYFFTRYFSKFIFNTSIKDAMTTSLIEVFEKFKSIKKKTKKDYETLIEKVSTFKQVDWVGGHVCGIPVLSKWSETLTKMPNVYMDWYHDEVKQIRDKYNFSTNKCAICQKRWLWNVYNGTNCPANAQPTCMDCVPNDLILNYNAECKPFSIEISPGIQHISNTFQEMFYEYATSTELTQDTFTQIYMRRIPEYQPIVIAKQILENQNRDLVQENTRLKYILNDLESENKHISDECNEYRITISELQKKIYNLEQSYHLNYSSAVLKRDNIIKNGQQQLEALHRENWHLKQEASRQYQANQNQANQNQANQNHAHQNFLRWMDENNQQRILTKYSYPNTFQGQ